MSTKYEFNLEVSVAEVVDRPNGGALAAFLAAGIGSAAVGLFVILSELGIYSAPALHSGAGGVSGRTTFGVIVWLLAWAILHKRWRKRSVDAAKVTTFTVLLVMLGLLLTFPPLWGLL